MKYWAIVLFAVMLASFVILFVQNQIVQIAQANGTNRNIAIPYNNTSNNMTTSNIGNLTKGSIPKA